MSAFMMAAIIASQNASTSTFCINHYHIVSICKYDLLQPSS